MIATGRLLKVGMVLIALGLVVAVAEQGYTSWVVALGVVVALAVVDAVSVWRREPPEVVRNVPTSLPLGRVVEVRLSATMPDGGAARIVLYDGVVPGLGEIAEPVRAQMERGETLTIEYQITPTGRGVYEFEPAHLRIYGPLGLVARQLRVGERQQVRVVPNFRAISRYALMAVADRMGNLGVRRLRRRGEGMEFDCLRDFREGDQLRQVDWKATARHRRLIARQYQDERNQQVVLVFDCGRRMRARDGALSHFDRSLNAGLLLSYVALRQGDSVAVGTFGGVDRWVPAQRGPQAVEGIVDQTFDLDTSMEPSDFAEAARRLSHRQKRRALVIFLTNLYDADMDELEQALGLLRRRHLVLVASLREQEVDELVEGEVRDLDEALQVGAAHNFLDHRREVHAQLQQAGALLMDVTPADLSVGLVNRYLEIKRSGRL